MISSFIKTKLNNDKKRMYTHDSSNLIHIEVEAPSNIYTLYLSSLISYHFHLISLIIFDVSHLTMNHINFNANKQVLNVSREHLLVISF